MILPIIFGIILAIGIFFALKALFDGPEMAGAFVVIACLTLFFDVVPGFVLPYVNSYQSYLEMKSFYEATVSQYRDAIEMYEEKAVFRINKVSFTDLRYQGYQENMSKFITDLRDKVARYNEVFVKKKIMSDNIFIGAYIIGPDEDMKIIKLQEGGR